MKQKLQNLLKDNYFRAFLVVFIIGIVLRFYQLEGYVTFLGDQGRDAIIIKRITTFEHFPAIGAPTSIGQVFLGPFYYYFIAPWLLLTNFNPVGLAIGVAVFSCLFIIAMYFTVADLIDKKTALLASTILAFSYVMINFSRFSWNPNLLPLFSLLYMYFLIKAINQKNFLKFTIAGAMLSFSIQLHYVALALCIPGVALLLHYTYQQRNNLIKVPKNLSGFIGSFLFFSLPLILFDLRHNFINSKNFIALFGDSSSASGNLINQVSYTFSAFNTIIFGYEMSSTIPALILIAMICIFIYGIKDKGMIKDILLFFLLTLIATALFTTNKYPHYLGALYPFYFIIIAFVLARIFWRKTLIIAIPIIVGLFMYFQYQKYGFLHRGPSYLINKAEKIAEVVQANISSDNFQVTGLPHQYHDSPYRYFLEIWGNRPLEKDSLDKADELFVICEDPCKPIGDSQWDIAYFAPTEIVGQWEAEGVTIYKLTR